MFKKQRSSHPAHVQETKESPNSCSGNKGDELENELGGVLFDRTIPAASTISSPNSCSGNKGDELENGLGGDHFTHNYQLVQPHRHPTHVQDKNEMS